MKKTKFEHPFQLSFKSMNTAVALDASDFYVETLRQAATRRCIFYADDCPEVREIIRKYEAGEVLPIPTKRILESRSDLHQRCLKALQEAL